LLCYLFTELCRVLSAARLNDEDTISTLGLTWQPSIDCFRFVFKDFDPAEEMSKRSLLFDISKIFDPLGLLTPVLIKGKIFLQLWVIKLGWDSPLSSNLQSRWKSFYCQFKDLEHIRLPRTVLNTGSPLSSKRTSWIRRCFARSVCCICILKVTGTKWHHNSPFIRFKVSCGSIETYYYS